MAEMGDGPIGCAVARRLCGRSVGMFPKPSAEPRASRVYKYMSSPVFMTLAPFILALLGPSAVSGLRSFYFETCSYHIGYIIKAVFIGDLGIPTCYKC